MSVLPSGLDRINDYGAPASLAMQARRTVEQEALVMRVRQFERDTKRLMRDLEACPNLNRQALFAGQGMLAAGVMLLVRSITREEIF